MPETTGKQRHQIPSTAWEAPSVPRKVEWKMCHDPYERCFPTEDQVRTKFPWGNVSGTWTPAADIQSDGIGARTEESEPEKTQSVSIDGWLRRLSRSQTTYSWNVTDIPAETDITETAPGSESSCREYIDTESEEDITRWDSARLAAAILQADTESNMPQLRDMILLAEDTDFTVEEDSQLAPWLLNFAERYRDSSDCQDAPAVLSAIRTGASMLTPDAAAPLRSLLQPGHSIETSLVAVKMLGRIFEAQPPTDVDQHNDLANEVSQIAESLLNRHVIAVIQSAAKAHLAIYALAAMGSSATERMIEIAQGLNAVWFTKRTLHKLTELRDVWATRANNVPERPLALLEQVIEKLNTNLTS